MSIAQLSRKLWKKTRSVPRGRAEGDAEKEEREAFSLLMGYDVRVAYGERELAPKERNER